MAADESVASRIEQASFELSERISTALMECVPEVAVKFGLDDGKVDVAILRAFTLQLAGAAVGIAGEGATVAQSDAEIEAELLRVSQVIMDALNGAVG